MLLLQAVDFMIIPPAPYHEVQLSKSSIVDRGRESGRVAGTDFKAQNELIFPLAEILSAPAPYAPAQTKANPLPGLVQNLCSSGLPEVAAFADVPSVSAARFEVFGKPLSLIQFDFNMIAVPQTLSTVVCR